jgi:hypothetical protein
MPRSTSYLAYLDCKEVLDRALLSTKGIRMEFKTEKSAVYFVSRCNSFRVLDRKENIYLYPEGHTMCGKSHYDKLRISRRTSVVEITPIVLDPSLVIVDIDTDPPL